MDNDWRRAREGYDAGRFEECAERFRLILRRDPENSEAHRHLADVLGYLGEWNEAALEYRRAVQYDPNNVTARAGLATSLAKRGAAEQAIIEGLEALRLGPDNCSAHSGLGDAFYHLGMWNAALFEYREGLRASPEDPWNQFILTKAAFALFEKAYRTGKWRGWLALLGSGRFAPKDRRASDKRRNWLAAIEAFEDYERRYPGSSSVLTLLGRAQWAIGERSLAADTLWKAFAADPTASRPFAYLGRALFILGRWKSLPLLFRRAVDGMCDNPHYRRINRLERWLDPPPKDK